MRRILVVTLFAAACVKGGPRPLRPAVEVKIKATPNVTYAAVLEAVADRGLPLLKTDKDLHLIETSYFDISTYLPEAQSYPNSERLVRYRIFVVEDTLTGGSDLAAVSIYSPFTIGSTRGTTRRDERATPKDHPAVKLVQEIVDRTRLQAEGR